MEQPTNNDNNVAASPQSKLIYDYTEKLHKAKSDNIDTLNVRLGLLLATNGTLLKFLFDSRIKKFYMDDWYCYSCIGLEVFLVFVSVSCIAASIYFCLKGLSPKEIGIVADPEELMKEEWYEASEEIQRAYIINTWIKDIECFESSITKKVVLIRKAIKLLVVGLIVFGTYNLTIIFADYLTQASIYLVLHTPQVT